MSEFLKEAFLIYGNLLFLKSTPRNLNESPSHLENISVRHLDKFIIA
jgi:hypothetical protein